ncbi:PilZ domain-containing protein [Halobacillus fulvus]|nr:PilZ domain-containing protein [Halobacillus fulvus]
MKDRRTDPFRYPFEAPLPGFFYKKDDRKISGPVLIKDISMNGLRFTTEVDLPLKMRDEVSLTFIYEYETFMAEGKLIWIKQENGETTCGLHAFEFSKRLQEIIEELGESLRVRK